MGEKTDKGRTTETLWKAAGRNWKQIPYNLKNLDNPIHKFREKIHDTKIQ